MGTYPGRVGLGQVSQRSQAGLGPDMSAAPREAPALCQAQGQELGVRGKEGALLRKVHLTTLCSVGA